MASRSLGFLKGTPPAPSCSSFISWGRKKLSWAFWSGPREITSTTSERAISWTPLIVSWRLGSPKWCRRRGCGALKDMRSSRFWGGILPALESSILPSRNAIVSSFDSRPLKITSKSPALRATSAAGGVPPKRKTLSSHWFFWISSLRVAKDFTSASGVRR